MGLESSFGEWTINQLCLLFKNRQVNLEPGFQRRSVWSLRDRRRLIKSIVSNCPVPGIFLYKREDPRLIYDVIDGKQRLETIFMYMGVGRFRRDRFGARLDLGEGPDWYEWSAIRRSHRKVKTALESYQIQTVEVEGELSEIVELFTDINSTGKRLTSGEKRHARFYKSPFLMAAESLVSQYSKYMLKEKILSPAQIDRMKGTELFSELLMSIHKGDMINKKTALDKAIGNESVNGNTLNRIVREFKTTLNLLKRMFPEVKHTRFHNTAEFYSLFMLVWEMNSQKLVLKDRKRNRVAQTLLKRLSTGVDELSDQLRRARPAKAKQRIYSDYLVTVRADTDSYANRERRARILRGLLFSLYQRKDDKRLFTPEQRRIIWNKDEKQVCNECGKQLRWSDFTVDHILAHARGGRTSLKNAQLLCRKHNSRKGAR